MNSRMKSLCKTVLMGTLFATVSSQAVEPLVEFNGDVTLTSDLVFRGLSYTNEEPSVYGGLEIEHKTGIHVKAWGGNVNLLEGDTVNPEDRGNLVFVVDAGYRGDVGDDFSYDLQISQYMLPGADDSLNYDFTELLATGTYSIQDTDLTLTYHFSPDFFLKSGQAHHFQGNITHTFANDFSIGGSLGAQTIEDNETFGFRDYTYYSFSVSAPLGDVTAGINYSDTDLKNASTADKRVYFTLSKTF
ncbi:TorF family putative porin [Candidatus Parabeggiatoa sp. HSG14]|uniref:TorF family putative porin n=1 Tax=Candidatus Parabeggiatoa sp. HSG14 TaxID=3055593 RepID=UPI0025A8DECF|nr:TorF family putative porin [Thiotrichales bacterium HSG14]